MQDWVKESIRGFIRGLSFWVGIFLGAICVFGIGYKLMVRDASLNNNSQYEMQPSGNSKGMFSGIDQERSLFLEIPVKGLIGGKDTTSESIIEMVEEAFTNVNNNDTRGIAAILVIVDSSGGYLDDSVRLHNCLKNWRAREQVPVYVFIEGTCASGALLVSCGADRVFAHSFSRIGSIGVMQIAFSLKELLNTVGVNLQALVAGEGKDDLFPGNVLTDESIARRQLLLDELYSRFVDLVAKNRRIDSSRIRDIGARMFVGEQALECGLIDEVVNSREDFLERVEYLLGTKNASVVRFKKVLSFREKIGCFLFNLLKEICVSTESHIIGKSF